MSNHYHVLAYQAFGTTSAILLFEKLGKYEQKI